MIFVDAVSAFSVLIGTYGAAEWEELAWSRAYPSASGWADSSEVLVKHDPDGTLASVRNQLAKEATGTWLVFLDADDELGRGYLEAMEAAIVAHTSHLDVTFPGGSRKVPVLPTGTLFVPAVQYVSGIEEEPPRVLNDGRPLSVINRAVIGTVVSRSLFLEVGGFPEEPVYEDWSCWLACERAGATLVDVPAAVYRAWVNPAGRNLPSSRERIASYSRIQRDHEMKLAEARRQRALL